MRISDWSSDVCSSDLDLEPQPAPEWLLTLVMQGQTTTGISTPAKPREPFDLTVVIPEGNRHEHIWPILRDLYRAGASYAALRTHRSAERRVGKECASTFRSRWVPYL